MVTIVVAARRGFIPIDERLGTIKIESFSQRSRFIIEQLRHMIILLRNTFQDKNLFFIVLQKYVTELDMQESLEGALIGYPFPKNHEH